jgi:hypothetical protein
MTSMMKAVVLVAGLAFCGTANASVIDLTTASNDGATLVATDATITAGASSTLFVGDFVANSVCPAGTFGCNGSMTLTFDFDVTNVFFDYGYGNDGDSAALSLFDGLGILVANVLLTSTSGVVSADLSGYGTIRSIFFDNTAATGAGYAYGDINYTQAATVPLPASLPLMMAGMGGLAMLRRKRKA